MPWAPQRGDVVWISFTPQAAHEQAGHEQAGRRSAAVLSPQRYNDKVGLAVLCPITSALKGYPFEVPLPADLPVHGVVLADQVKSLDWRIRQAEFACRLPEEVVLEVLQKLNTLVGP